MFYEPQNLLWILSKPNCIYLYLKIISMLTSKKVAKIILFRKWKKWWQCESGL